ncbi:MAG: anti-sigma factor family protein [Caulobacteraceae bacterium]
MSCEFDKELLQKYVDNTIDPLEQVFLKEHITYCGACRNELEALMAVEKSLDSFFDDDIEVKDLDAMIRKVVDDGIYEVQMENKLKYAFGKGLQISKGIAQNSSRYIGFLPGSRLIKKGIKATASKTGSLVKTLIKREVNKFLMNS